LDIWKKVVEKIKPLKPYSDETVRDCSNNIIQFICGENLLFSKYDPFIFPEWIKGNNKLTDN
jgi:hypothetical protein